MHYKHKNAREQIHPELREMFVDHKNRIIRLQKPVKYSRNYWKGFKRPRPLMGPFHGPNFDYHIRKKDLTYWELLEKYPPPSYLGRFFAYHHVFQIRHHLAHNPDNEPLYGYIMAVCGITVFVGIVFFYLFILWRLSLWARIEGHMHAVKDKLCLMSTADGSIPVCRTWGVYWTL